MIIKLHHLGGGEGSQLAHVRQLREQHAAVDVHRALERARAEIEVETALVTLLHEVGVG